VPLFLAGVAVFAMGVRTIVRVVRPVPFEEQVAGVRHLIEAGEFNQAIEAINTLGDYYTDNAQQGELQILAAETHYLAEKKLEAGGSLVRVNYERIKDHYRKAVIYGSTITPDMNQRWAEAALATGDGTLAAEKLEAAIADAGEDAEAITRRHGRNLVMTYISLGRRERAIEAVDRMLAALPAIAESDQESLEARTWCLSRRIEIALKGPLDATTLAMVVADARTQADAIRNMDVNLAGRILTWIGRAELQTGARQQAETDLAAARAAFTVRHVDDGRAALMLGMLRLDRGDAAGAAKLFQEVIVGHAGTTLWPAARLGRAVTATRTGAPLDETMRADYQFAIDVVKETAEKPAVGREPELITPEGVRASLADGYRRALAADRLMEALSFLHMERGVAVREPIDLALRLATTREYRANQLMIEAGTLEGAPAAARRLEARAMMADSAADYLRHGRATTLNDEQSGSSLWKAGELFDQAGETMRAIAVYEQLTIQRPRDARVSEGMLALGRLYQSAGMIDKAIETHERNVRENRNTPASYSSAVAAAHCYMTRGDHAATPESRDAAYGSAEKLLLALVQDDTNLRPAALGFRESLVTLGDLYFAWSTRIVEENAGPAATTAPATAPATARSYRPARWSDAILRLDEALKRYGNDRTWDAASRVRFLLAQSYRRSAIEIGAVLERDPQLPQRPELQKARADRLATASQEFSRLIALLDAEALDAGMTGRRKLTDLEQDYLRTSYLDRAACHFDRGEYDEAIALYDRAAARFAEEIIAVQAYVQIVNAYLIQKQPAQANAAAERGRWMLKRIPEGVFGESPVGAGRAYYEQLLALGGG
jgi:tetratricopeptide (TPR) repeat protein